MMTMTMAIIIIIIIIIMIISNNQRLRKWKVKTLSIQRCALGKFQLSVVIVTASC